MTELYRRKQQEIQDKIDRQQSLEKNVKNLFINSNMEFWQRGQNPVIGLGTTFAYGADRWRTEAGGSSANGNQERISDSPDFLKYPFSALVYDAGGVISDSSNISFLQPIESKFIEQYSGKQMTLSFWIKTQNYQAGTQLFLRVRTPLNGDDNYATNSGRIFINDNPLHYDEEITAQVGTVWTKLTKTFTCPDFNIYNKGLCVGLVQLKNNIATIVNEGFRTTGWMLTEGVAEDGYEFEWQRAGKDYANELELCERYFEKGYNLDTPPGSNLGTGGMTFLTHFRNQSSTEGASTEFRVRKRTVPVMTPYRNNGTAGLWLHIWSSSSLYSNPNLGASETFFRGNPSSTSGSRGTAVHGSGQWTADAEI